MSERASAAIIKTDPEMLRRAAEACRNVQEQSTGDESWFDWVPKYLDRLADGAEQNGSSPTGGPS